MNHKLVLRMTVVLFVLSLVAFVSSCANSGNSSSTASSGSGSIQPPDVPPAFQNRDEAKTFLEIRLLNEKSDGTAANPYRISHQRGYRNVNGKRKHFILTRPAKTEYQLLRGFQKFGFHREALHHCRNLAQFSPDTKYGKWAKQTLPELESNTLLDHFPPGTVLFENKKGKKLLFTDKKIDSDLVDAAGGENPERILENIHQPALQPAGDASKDELSPHSILGKQGELFEITEWSRKMLLMYARKFHGGPMPEGLLTGDKPNTSLHCYSIPKEASTLAEARNMYKQHLLDNLKKFLEKPENKQSKKLQSSLAFANLYVGRKKKAMKIYGKLDESPGRQVDKNRNKIAKSPAHPLYPEATWNQSTNSLPLLEIETDRTITTGKKLNATVRAENITEATFSFHRIEKDLPSGENTVNAWLKKIKKSTPEGSPVFTKTVPLENGKNSVSISIPAPGVYHVLVTANDLKTSFVAGRTDLSPEAFVFPGREVLHLSGGEFLVKSGNEFSKKTDGNGFVRFDSPDHDNEFFIKGNGQFALARMSDSTRETDRRHTVYTDEPILLLYTDRPVYRAGDTVKFRGIARISKYPLDEGDTTRLEPAVGKTVHITVKNDSETVYKESLATGEQGTFHGNFQLSDSVSRTDYDLILKSMDHRYTATFEVKDYEKSNYEIQVEDTKEGIRIEAGYVWGSDVPGSRILVKTDSGKSIEVKNGLAHVKNGTTLNVFLKRNDKILAQTKHTYRKPDSAPGKKQAKTENEKQESVKSGSTKNESTPSRNKSENENGATKNVAENRQKETGKTGKKPPVTVRTDRSLYRSGGVITATVSTRLDADRAWIILGDVQPYAFRRVRLENGTATATFDVHPAYDPRVGVHAVVNGHQDSTTVKTRAALLPVQIDAPETGAPGEIVDVTITSERNAALSVAAVDESIFSIRKDSTPVLYNHFYPERPVEMAYERCAVEGFSGDRVGAEPFPEHPNIRKAFSSLLSPFLYRNREYFDITIGLGGSVGSNFGSARGGSEDLGKRGGSGRTQLVVMELIPLLADKQNDDGSWSAETLSTGYPLSKIGATALALNAFQRMGYTHLSDETFDGINSGEVIKKGLSFLKQQQRKSGRFGSPEKTNLLDHTLAVLANANGYNRTGSSTLKSILKKGLNHLKDAQVAKGGWGLRTGESKPNLVVTAWATVTLREAEAGGYELSNGILKPLQRYLRTAIGADGLPVNQHEYPGSLGTAAAFVASRAANVSGIRSRLRSALGHLLTDLQKGNIKDLHTLALATLAIHIDTVQLDTWTLWTDGIHEKYMSQLTGTDSDRTPANLSVSTLTLASFYRYEHGFYATTLPEHRLSSLFPGERMRMYFPDTAYWNPSLVVGEDGKARLQLRLPERITSLRLTTRGITKTGKTGEETERIRIEKPFFVKLKSPHFAVHGDTFEVRALLFNYAGEPGRARIRLNGGSWKSVNVAPGSPASVSWSLDADQRSDIDLKAEARFGRHSDSIRKTIPVRRKGTWIRKTKSVKCKTGSSCTLNAPEQTEHAVLKIHPKLGNLTRILDALRYLNDYPHG